MPNTAAWEAKIQAILVGRTITKAAYLSASDADELGWGRRPLVITLDDGTELIPMSDDEGNDGGAIATNVDNCQCIPVMR